MPMKMNYIDKKTNEILGNHFLRRFPLLQCFALD